MLKSQLLRLQQPNCDLSLSLLLLLMPHFQHLYVKCVAFISFEPRIKIKKSLIHLMEIPSVECVAYMAESDAEMWKILRTSKMNADTETRETQLAILYARQ